MDTPPIMAAHLAGAELRRGGPVPAIDRPYFLTVGTIEPRKNHETLLDVWRGMAHRMKDATPGLVLIGQWGAGSGRVRQMLMNDPLLASHVTILERCSDREMAGWIESAQAVLLPTLAEGFGLPMIEALSLGTPVVASNLPCFRENGQGIPLLVDPMDKSGWERGVAMMGADQVERNRQVAQMAGFRRPSWDSHFAQVDRWLDHLLSDRTSRSARGTSVDHGRAPSFARRASAP